MSVRNFKIPLKGYDAALSFSAIDHEDYTSYEIALMGTNDHKEYIFIGEPIQVFNLTEAHDILYTIINQDDWSYFTHQYEVTLELEPQLELVVDNDKDKSSSTSNATE